MLRVDSVLLDRWDSRVILVARAILDRRALLAERVRRAPRVGQATRGLRELLV